MSSLGWDLSVYVCTLSVYVCVCMSYLLILYGDVPGAVLSTADVTARDKEASLEEFHVCVDGRH